MRTSRRFSSKCRCLLVACHRCFDVVVYCGPSHRITQVRWHRDTKFSFCLSLGDVVEDTMRCRCHSGSGGGCQTEKRIMHWNRGRDVQPMMCRHVMLFDFDDVSPRARMSSSVLHVGRMSHRFGSGLFLFFNGVAFCSTLRPSIFLPGLIGKCCCHIRPHPR